MRIRLLKSWTHYGKKYPMGRIINITPSLGQRLINEGTAEKYTGEYPPRKKMKTDFFKPKTQWQ